MARKKSPRTDGRTSKGTFAPGVSGRSLVPAKAGQDPFIKNGIPQVIPVQIRTDGYQNFFTGLGVAGRDKRLGAKFVLETLSWDEMRELAQGDDLAKRACETMPREAFRQGWDLVISEEEGDEDEEERVKEILLALEKLNAKAYLKQALAWERIFGGGAILIGVNDGQSDLSKPLNLDKVKSIDWLTPLEPRECLPVYGYADLQSEKYGRPEIYRISSRTQFPDKDGKWSQQMIDVHETRLLIFPGSRISRYQPNAQSGGWGDSILLPMWRVLRDFNMTWAAAGALVADFSSAVYKFKDLWQILASDDADEFQKRLLTMDMTRSQINATVIGDEDEFSRTSSSIAGLPDLLDKFSTRLAAAADMPVTLLFGTSPGGMNATGDSDIRFFYDRVAEYQEERVLHQLKKLIQIVMRTTGVKTEPKKWDITFRPLWQESAKDKAGAMLTQAQADVAWITAGVLSAEEVAAAHWQSGKYNPDITVDFAARESQDQPVAAPINQADLNAVDPEHPDYKGSSLDPNNKNYIEPPPGSPMAMAAAGGPGGAPGAKPKSTNPFARTDRGRYDYDPSEERDESGKWSGGGGGGGRAPRTGPNAAVDSIASHATFKASVKSREASVAGTPKAHMAAAVAHEKAAGLNRKVGLGDFDYTAQEHDAKATEHRMTALALDAKANGGFTVEPKTGGSPKKGYSVAIHGEREQKLVGKEAVTPGALGDYIKKNHDVFSKDPQAHIGGWYNHENDTWYLDVPHVEKDVSVAAGLGKANNQLAIYDLKRGEQIDAKEYPDAIAKTGRFKGRRDGAGLGLGSENADTGGDGRGHEGAPSQNPGRVGSDGRLNRADYSPDQERDERGRFGSGSGGSAPVGDPASLHAIAVKAINAHKVDLPSTLERMRSIAGPKDVVSGRTKDVESALEKVQRKPHYRDVSQLQDLTGVRIVTPDMAETKKVVENIRAHFKVVNEDDYTQKPQVGGYRAHHLIIEDRGLQKEVQIQTQNQRNFQKWSHAFYKPENQAQGAAKVSFGPAISAYADAASARLAGKDAGLKDWALPPVPTLPPEAEKAFGHVQGL